MSIDLKARLARLRGKIVQLERSRTVDFKPPARSLADRLQRLGATSPKHARGPKHSDQELARLLRGECIAEGVVQIEDTIPMSAHHGRIQFGDIHAVSLSTLIPARQILPAKQAASLRTMHADEPGSGISSDDSRAIDPPRDGLLFLDTETTGLAGGTGTVVFLLGLARIEGQVIRMRQYFLTAFKGEAAMLRDALDWMARASHLVTYNGKSFDVPLLSARYRLARAEHPLACMRHLDLLHATRTAFAKVWPDCRLQTAERNLFKLYRDDEVSGALIPEVWTSFMRAGDPSRLRAIAEHNQRDVLSLIALLVVLARAYCEPGYFDADTLSIARSHKRKRNDELARSHLEQGAASLLDDGWLELAALHRRARRWHEAVAIWEQLAEHGSLQAIERLAKYHEHVRRDRVAALAYASKLLAREPDSPAHIRRRTRLAAEAAL